MVKQCTLRYFKIYLTLQISKYVSWMILIVENVLNAYSAGFKYKHLACKQKFKYVEIF